MTSRLQKIIILILFCLVLCNSCEKETDLDPTTKKLTAKKWILSKEVQYSYLNNILDTIRLSYNDETFLFSTNGELEISYNDYISNYEWWLNEDKSIIKINLYQQVSFPITKLSEDSLILVSQDITVTGRRDWLDVNSIIDTYHHVTYKHYGVVK